MESSLRRHSHHADHRVVVECGDESVQHRAAPLLDLAGVGQLVHPDGSP